MDTALRAAERTYASDPTPEHRDALLLAAARAGQPLCAECESSDATHRDDSGEPRCDLCRESALLHGHAHGMHDDEDVKHCPRCDATRPRLWLCPVHDEADCPTCPGNYYTSR